MILGQLKDLEKYSGIHKNLDTAIQFITEHAEKLRDYPNGSHPIDGDAVFMNRFDYNTLPLTEAFFEAHRNYADIHLVLSGCELLGYEDLTELSETVPYRQSEDFAGYEGTPALLYRMTPGCFAVCFPEDVHMPKISAEDEASHVEKAVIKVKIDTPCISHS